MMPSPFRFASLTRLLAAACLGLLLGAAPALALALEAGKDYLEIPPQRVEARGKVEVVEFFWYRCPHCSELEPDLEDWAKKLPRDVVLKRQPAVLNDGWMPLTRAFFALESLGLTGKLHKEAFRAIHGQGIDLNDPDTFFDWAEGKGVDRRKLKAAYESFGVATQANRARQLTRDYKINGVPAFVVNGRYLTSAYLTGGHPQLFATLDALIARERKKPGKR